MQAPIAFVRHVLLSGLEVTTYPFISAPPFELGAVQETLTDLVPRTVTTVCGADALVKGVTTLVVDIGADVPAELDAVTTNRYGVPLVNPVIAHEVAPVVEQVNIPSSVLAT